MSVTEFLTSEVQEKRKAVLVSSLLKRFDHSQVVKESHEFSSQESVEVFVTVSASSDRGTKLSVMPLRDARERGFSNFQIFAFKPKDSAESNSAVWKRGCEATRSEIISAKPHLWHPSHAVIVSESTERQIAVAVVAAPVPVKTNNSSSSSTSKSGNSGSKLGFTNVSGPKEVKAAPKPVPPAEPVKRAAPAKFQVPLDRLDEPMLPEKENSETCHEEAPVVATAEDEATEPASPEPKRARVTDPPMETVSSSASVVSVISSEPQFREVVIKRKQIVTEYVMGENGEMIVRDVEKMIEEVRMEQVKPSSVKSLNSNKTSGSPTSASGKGPKATPGQFKMTNFFKAKN